MYKIGILETHPIQYKTPWFRLLHKHPEIDLIVFYCMIPDAKQQGEGFGVEFMWDTPLLEGYKYNVLNNIAKDSGTEHFTGCDTPEIYNLLNSSNSRFDAFIINGWHVKSCLQTLWACKKNKIPCIIRGESNDLRYRVWWKQLIHRLLLKQYAAFLNIGKSNKTFYVNNGVSEEKLFFAPYCIDNLYFTKMVTSRKPERGNIRSAWGINPGACTFLFCGKFIDKKRPLDLIQAFLLAYEADNKRSLNMHLLMTGDGELKQECERLVNEHNLPVTFTGFLNQSELAKAYLVADCMVLPSDNGETWGLVINEGMACGLPAIVSDQVGSHLDLIIENQTGAVYPCGEVYALFELLAEYANNPNKLKRMGAEARHRIELYSYDEVVKGTIDAVKWVCRSI